MGLREGNEGLQFERRGLGGEGLPKMRFSLGGKGHEGHEDDEGRQLEADCHQEARRQGQEGVIHGSSRPGSKEGTPQRHQDCATQVPPSVDRRRPSSKEGTPHQGVWLAQEGLAPLRQGESALLEDLSPERKYSVWIACHP